MKYRIRKLTAKDLQRVEEATERVRAELASLVKPIMESRRITAADLAITINARDDEVLLCAPSPETTGSQTK